MPAKRELSSTLRNLKFMQRAAVVQKVAEKSPEVEAEVEAAAEVEMAATGGVGSSVQVARKCIVIMEGNPHPGAVKGRMSFQNFNPSIDALIQMEDLASAVSVLQYYTTIQPSIRGRNLRGRNVYLQFSSHQELTTDQSSHGRNPDQVSLTSTYSWFSWIRDQQESEGVLPGEDVYIILRLDGRVRRSGRGMPKWNDILQELPQLENLLSKLER